MIKYIPIRLNSCPPPSHPHAQIQGEKWAKGRKLGRIGISNSLDSDDVYMVKEFLLFEEC